MNELASLVSEHLFLLVGGSTFILGLGCLAVALSRSPAHRQRLAEITVASVLVWLVLALLPLPRFALLFPQPHGNDGALSAELSVTLQRAADDAKIDPVHGSMAIPGFDDVRWAPADSAWTLPAADEDAFGLRAAPRNAGALSELTGIEAETPDPRRPAISLRPSSMDSGRDILGSLLGLYMLGGIAYSVWIVSGHLILLRLRASGSRPPAWLKTQYQELALQAGVPPAELLVSRHCARPISWGVVRPTIVLPHRLCREENRTLISTILLHELSHVGRRDAWGNLLFCLASPLLYGHPLYWWLRRDWSLAAELVADDWAAWQTGKDVYIEELLELARVSQGRGLPLVAVSAVFSSPSQFYRRMHMLLAREQRLSTRTSLLWQSASLALAALGIALVAAVGGVRPASGQVESADPAGALPAAEAPPEKVPALEASEKPEEKTTIPVKVKFAGDPVGAPDITAEPSAAAEAEAHARSIKELQAEQAFLEAQIQKLQARLKELGALPPPPKDPSIVPGKSDKDAAGTVTLKRVDTDGTVRVELWSADEKGQPQKLIKSSEAARLPGNVTKEPASDGKVLKAFEENDGTITVQVFDAATGKQLETHRTTPGNKPGKKPRPASNSPDPDKFTPASPARPAAIETPLTGGGHREVDLVALATSYADAVGELEAAGANFAEIEAVLAHSPNSLSKQESTKARLAVAAAQRKEQLLRRIAMLELESVSRTLDRTTRSYEAGVVPVGEVEGGLARAEILKQILRTQPAEQENVLPKYEPIRK